MKILKTAIALLFCSQALAQTPVTFTGFDIATGSLGLAPNNFFVSGTKMYFIGSTPIVGSELCVSDGTTAGTTIVKDINPGTAGSDIREFTEMGGKVYFVANDGSHGEELWVTDGTAAGTQMVADIEPGASGSYCRYLTVKGSNIIFTAYKTGSGFELWTTDGTSAGTQLLKDTRPGNSDGYPKFLTSFNGAIYFQAYDNTNGRELWTTDGTTAGTQLFKDIYPGNSTSDPREFTVVNNKMIFRAEDGTNGAEMWVTDGTASGTQLLKDIKPGASGSINYTVVLDDVKLPVYNNRVYFGADDGVNGREIWYTDGTTAGTQLLKDIVPGASGNNDVTTYPTAIHNNKMYFTASEPVYGQEIWETDGTTAGTQLAIETLPGTGGSIPAVLASYGSKLYITATNASMERRLYQSDGTTAGTYEIAPAGATNTSPIIEYTQKCIFNNALYFPANYNAIGHEMWSIQESTTSIPLVANTSFITLYPNPAHNNFTIKTTTAFKAGSVTLTDVTGRVVKTQKLHTNLETIAVEGIAPGIYMVDVWLDDKLSTQKLIIQ